MVTICLVHVSLDMKHTISTKWCTNPSQGHSHFLHNFQSLYKYRMHYGSEDSCANGHIGHPQLCRLLNL